MNDVYWQRLMSIDGELGVTIVFSLTLLQSIFKRPWPRLWTRGGYGCRKLTIDRSGSFMGQM